MIAYEIKLPYALESNSVYSMCLLCNVWISILRKMHLLVLALKTDSPNAYKALVIKTTHFLALFCLDTWNSYSLLYYISSIYSLAAY
jgi:hypothetical protein